MDLIALGTLASLAAAAMTAVGAIPVLFGREVSPRAQDTFLGFAAGVMLAASFFSLIIPAIAASERMYGGSVVPAVIAAGGVLVGAIVIALLNEWACIRSIEDD
jgi:zinc transporter, ZIP family